MNQSQNGKTPTGETGQAVSLEGAYSFCRRTARHHAKTFYMAARFLPRRQQQAIFSMYALLRTVDDLVDQAEDKLESGAITRKEITALLEGWKERLHACYKGDTGDDPIMMTWRDTLEHYTIPIELPLDLIDGVAMDIEFTPFETFEELYVYCYKVASVVGLMTSEIFGYSDRQALQHAIELGIAMQLTNILRDIGEDIDRGRIYLPLEDLRRFGYSEEEFMQRTMNDSFRRLMQFQIERARSYYRSSDKGIPMLHSASRFAVATSSVNYAAILDSVEENGYDVFHQRAYRSFMQKLRTLPAIWLKTRKSGKA